MAILKYQTPPAHKYILWGIGLLLAVVSFYVGINEGKHLNIGIRIALPLLSLLVCLLMGYAASRTGMIEIVDDDLRYSYGNFRKKQNVGLKISQMQKLVLPNMEENAFLAVVYLEGTQTKAIIMDCSYLGEATVFYAFVKDLSRLSNIPVEKMGPCDLDALIQKINQKTLA